MFSRIIKTYRTNDVGQPATQKAAVTDSDRIDIATQAENYARFLFEHGIKTIRVYPLPFKKNGRVNGASVIARFNLALYEALNRENGGISYARTTDNFGSNHDLYKRAVIRLGYHLEYVKPE